MGRCFSTRQRQPRKKLHRVTVLLQDDDLPTFKSRGIGFSAEAHRFERLLCALEFQCDILRK